MAMQDLPEKGMKAILIRHVEKFVFAIVCLASLFILWKAWQYKAYERTPGKLVSAVNTAKANMDAIDWEQAGRESDLPQQLDAIPGVENPIPYSWYGFSMLWHMPPFPPSSKRGDPELLPVEELIVSGVGSGPIALDGSAARPVGRGVQGGGGARHGGGLIGGGEEGEEQAEPIDPTVQSRLPGFRASGDHEIAPTNYVAITGLIPNRLQFQNYAEAFSFATGYRADRDKPKWFQYQVQRVDVTDNPGREVADEEWSIIANLNTVKEALSSSTSRLHWAGELNEVVDDRLTLSDSNYPITSPIPPILLRDLRSAASHPEIPLYDASAQQEDEEAAAEEPQDEQPRDEFGFEAVQDRAADREHPTHDPRDEESSSHKDSQIEYKLFRFFDLTVESGHIYRYRVRLVLEDPNNPQSIEQAPPIASLEDAVVQRVMEARRGADQDQPAGKFYRFAPWSEPTAPVMVPIGRQVLAGPVTEAAAIQRANNRLYPSPYSDRPIMDLLVAIWDEAVEVDDVTLPMDMIAPRAAHRGSLLNFTQTAKVLDPSTLDFVLVNDYRFELDQVVLDVVGGEDLPGANRDDDLLSGGQILILDLFGNLQVHDELDEANLSHELQYLPEELSGDDNAAGGGLLQGGAGGGGAGFGGILDGPRRNRDN